MHHDTFRLGLNDRVRYRGEHYRPEARDDARRLWVLRRLVDGSALDGHPWHLTDKDHYRLRRSDTLLVDEEYFSLAGQLLSARGDDSDLSDLTEDQQLTIAWKVEWCTRFYRARALLGGYAERPARTPQGIEAFIQHERDRVHHWFVKKFRKPRPPGRNYKDRDPKPYDYPSATGLREWMDAHEAHGYKAKAFRPGYARCGNRNQLHGLTAAIVEREVKGFASRAKPTFGDIHERVLDRLDLLNRARPADDQLRVSERAVRRRIHNLDPIFVEAGRKGPEVAARKYTPIGHGLETLDGLSRLERMSRVEMDDWEMDLFAIVNDKQLARTLSQRGREKAAEIDRTVRCTVTAAIDVVTKCFVGLNVVPRPPSCAGSRTALRTIVVDKTPIARAAKCRNQWAMFAKPGEIATDGGPVFKGEFHDAVERLGIEHRWPGGSPAMRGTIESSFRHLKRFCRRFTGQAFSNVVERGDYDAQRCASLVAAELHRLLVRFVVDDYHQRPHPELGGARPQTAWEQAGNTLRAPPDHIQRQVAFGIHLTDRTIDAAGVTFLHIAYRHPKMALLHGRVGKRRLTIVVDPHDLRRILVRIPEEARRDLDGEGDYMEFECRSEFHGISMLAHLNNCGVLRAMEREEEAAGRPFRVDAHQDLDDAAEKARIRAGVTPDKLSGETYLRLIKGFERDGERATKPRPAPKGASMAEDAEPDVLGTSIAKPPGTARVVSHVSPEPQRSRSINRFREDER